MAPEIQNGNYDSQCDNWSVGVLLYVFMSGYLPFQGQDRNEVFEKIKNADYHFKHEEFQIVSEEVKDLISKLLVANPKEGLTAGQALSHPWM
jgi:calcium-dependent protein kinase